MTARVQVKRELLEWACERSGHALAAYKKKFPKIEEWASGDAQPTLKQLETFAKATRTPVGFLFLQEPPEESVPLPDFRTVAGRRDVRPSPDLLETIYVCEQRQEWYRDFARSMGERPLGFVGSVSVSSGVVSTAAKMREELGFDLDEQRRAPTWTDALRGFIAKADEAGVMVMSSGVVLNNTSRPLDPDEFRGFALCDPLAPVVFVNGADTKAAQMFTLAHELAHVWLGETALSDAQASSFTTNSVERWCNQVAAELLVPLALFRSEYQRGRELRDELDRLARRFKVSTLVILRRMHDAGGLTREKFGEEFEREKARLKSLPRGSGGNFYLTQAARVSKRFARAIVISTMEGQTLYRDAFRMLGMSKQETFQKLAVSLGVA